MSKSAQASPLTSAASQLVVKHHAFSFAPQPSLSSQCLDGLNAFLRVVVPWSMRRELGPRESKPWKTSETVAGHHNVGLRLVNRPSCEGADGYADPTIMLAHNDSNADFHQ